MGVRWGQGTRDKDKEFNIKTKRKLTLPLWTGTRVSVRQSDDWVAQAEFQHSSISR